MGYKRGLNLEQGETVVEILKELSWYLAIETSKNLIRIFNIPQGFKLNPKLIIAALAKHMVSC
jgi:hypothetical protein